MRTDDDLCKLLEVHPEAHALVIQLPEEYQRTVTLALPIWSDEPFVGVEINGKLMKPADPKSYVICEQLMRLLWEEAPDRIRQGMEFSHQLRILYPYDIHDDFDGITIDNPAPGEEGEYEQLYLQSQNRDR